MSRVWEENGQMQVVDSSEVVRLRKEIETKSKALEQAIECAGLEVVTVVKDKSYGMWKYEGVTCIVGQSATENFFAGHLEDNPELATELEGRK